MKSAKEIREHVEELKRIDDEAHRSLTKALDSVHETTARLAFGESMLKEAVDREKFVDIVKKDDVPVFSYDKLFAGLFDLRRKEDQESQGNRIKKHLK